MFASKEFNEFYQERRLDSSEHAEEAAILIAMAQQQAEAVSKDRFPRELHNDVRLDVFRVCCLKRLVPNR